MPTVALLLSHHAVSFLSTALALALAVSVLRQRRSVGSSFAWVLAIVLVPYVGVPLYLVFGGRKFARVAGSKSRLRVPEAPGDELQRRLWSAAPLRERATRLEWLDDGAAAFRAMLRQIEGARRSIRIVTFVVGDDETGRTVVDALARRASEGLEVLLLLDDLLRWRAPRGHLARLAASGGRVERFMPLVHLPFRARSNLRNHRKIALFDGERAVVGGMNLADEYMGPAPSPDRWRDLSVLASGTCVPTLDAIFRSDWLFATRESLPPAAAAAAAAAAADGVPVQVVPSGPDELGDALYDVLLQRIFSASRRLWISTPYFVPDDALTKALVIAAHRGVDVRVIVPARSNHRLANVVAAPILRDLASVGVRVFQYPTMLHAKALLFDDTTAAIGSANFDMRSLFLDYEVALLFSGERETARLASWFEATLARAEERTPRSSWARAQMEDAARLLSPLV